MRMEKLPLYSRNVLEEITTHAFDTSQVEYAQAAAGPEYA